MAAKQARVHLVLLAAALVLLLVAEVPLLLRVAAAPAASEEEQEEMILASLKECSEKINPSEDDLTDISKGSLSTDASKAVISCWFKGAKVMQDKMFQKDQAVTFLRALTPGDPKNDNVKLMKKLTEKCDSEVNSKVKNDSSETDVAVMIYDCMVREGRAMRLSLEEGNSASTSAPAV